MPHSGPKRSWKVPVIFAVLTAILTACGAGAPQSQAQGDSLGLEALPAPSSQILRAQDNASVVRTTPAEGATGVATSAGLQLEFAQAANRSSVETAFALFPGKYDLSANPATFTKLGLTSMCNGRWRVRNSNASPISFAWDAYSTTERGVGVVPGNTDVFFSSSLGKTVRVFVGTAQQNVKASNPAVCTTSDFSFTWSADDKKVTVQPSMALETGKDYTLVLSTKAADSSGNILVNPLAVRFDTRITVGANTVTQLLGSAGGTVSLNNTAFVVAASGAVLDDTRFTITRLSTPPSPIPLEDDFLLNQVPGARVVSAYRFEADKPIFTTPVDILFPIDASYSPNEEVITELYRYDGTSYTRIRIDERPENFLYQPIQLTPGGDTLVAVRAPVAAYTQVCTARGGSFNGSYCELPFPDGGGLSGQSARGITAQQTVTQNYNVITFNVGNGLFSGANREPRYCLNYGYKVKLCSLAIEANIRGALIKDAQQRPLDLMALQELWNNRCEASDDKGTEVIQVTIVGFISIPRTVSNIDRVCGNPKTRLSGNEQIGRLISRNLYDYRCSPVREFPNSALQANKYVNGYECVAIQKSIFFFPNTDRFGNAITPGRTIQPPCDDAALSSTVYYRGSDTGYQVETVGLRTSAGMQNFTYFDVVNSHMIDAFSADCRTKQLTAMRGTYLNGSLLNPKPFRFLIMGDFNTDYYSVTDNSSTFLRRNISLSDVAVNFFPQTRFAYFLSNPGQGTTGLVGFPLTASAFGYDHVMTNFADGTCEVRNLVLGTDHRRTNCILKGFDSGSSRALVTIEGNFTSSAYVQLYRKGVPLKYVREENPLSGAGTGIYILRGIPDDVSVSQDTYPCNAFNFNLPITSQFSVSAGQTQGLGVLDFNFVTC